MLNFGKLFHFYFATAAFVVVAALNTGLNDSETCPNQCECYLNVVACVRKQLNEIPNNIPSTTQVL